MDSKFPSPPELLPKLTKVIYHGEDCADGYMCKFLIQRWLTEQNLTLPKFIPANRREVYSHVEKDDKILMVDFVYNEEIMGKWMKITPEIYLVDHHKTALKCPLVEDHKFLDMKHSASAMIHEWLYPLGHRSRLLDLIEDRDIWTKKYPESDALAAYLAGKKTDEVYTALLHDRGLQDAIEKGQIIKQFQDETVTLAASKAAIKIWDNNLLYAVVNATSMASDIGNKLMQTHLVDFAVVLTVDTRTGHTIMSFRSAPGKADVSKIAEQFGGGGHHDASASRIDHPVHELPRSKDGSRVHYLLEAALVDGDTANINYMGSKQTLIAKHAQRLLRVKRVHFWHMFKNERRSS